MLYLCAWSCFSQWTSLTSWLTFTSLSFTVSYTCTSPIQLMTHLSCPQLDYACRSFTLIFIDSTPAAQKSTREMGTERKGGEKPREWEENKDMEANRENTIRRELERRRYAKVKDSGLSWRVWFSPPSLPAESFFNNLHSCLEVCSQRRDYLQQPGIQGCHRSRYSAR